MNFVALAVPLFFLKFGGYTLAGRVLTSAYRVEGSAVLFGLVRTLAGMLIGGTVVYLLQPSQYDLSGTYAVLITTHFVVWALSIAVFFGRDGEDWSRIIFAAVVGTVWSCVLDIPSFVIAIPFFMRTC